MTGNTWHISRIYWAAVHPAKYAGTIRAPRQTFPAAQSRLPSLEGSGEPAGGKACESPSGPERVRSAGGLLCLRKKPPISQFPAA